MSFCSLVSVLLAWTAGGLVWGAEIAHGTEPAPDRTQPGSDSTEVSSQQEATSGAELLPVVEKVQAAYSELETLRAKFSQTATLASGGKVRTDTGTVELKKGGKMRWDFVSPEARQFISDGKTLWIYSPEDKQVIISSLQAGASRTAMSFMFGLGDLSRDFSPSLASEKEYRKAGRSALHLVPKETIGTLKRLTIMVSESDGMVREAEIRDHMGNVTHVTFSELEKNIPIGDERFAFQTPDGVMEIQTQGF